MLLKCHTQYVSKFGKLSRGHRIGKSQFSFQSQRRAIPKNIQTTLILCSFQMLARLVQNPSCQASAVHEPRTSWCTNWVSKRQRKQRSNCQHLLDHEEAREFRKNMYFCFTDYAKAFDCVDHNKLWKIPKEMGVPDHLIYLLRYLYMGQEATIRTGHGTYYWFPIGKGVL